MNRRELGMSRFVYPDSFCFDVLFEKIKYAQNSELFKGLRKPCLEPEPGRKVGVASFRIQDGLHLKPVGVFQNALHLNLHALIVS